MKHSSPKTPEPVLTPEKGYICGNCAFVVTIYNPSCGCHAFAHYFKNKGKKPPKEWIDFQEKLIKTNRYNLK